MTAKPRNFEWLVPIDKPPECPNSPFKDNRHEWVRASDDPFVRRYEKNEDALNITACINCRYFEASWNKNGNRLEFKGLFHSVPLKIEAKT